MRKRKDEGGNEDREWGRREAGGRKPTREEEKQSWPCRRMRFR